MRSKQLLAKKNRYKTRSFTNISNIILKFLIIYLATIGQFVAVAQHIRSTPKQGSRIKKLGASDKLPVINNLPSSGVEKKGRPVPGKHQPVSQVHDPIELALPRKLIERKFREALRPYQAITPTKVLTELGFQTFPQQKGERYNRDRLHPQKAYPDTSKSGYFFNPVQSAIIRSRALTDPYYSLLMSKVHLRASVEYSPRIAEIFILQAMLQASTLEEIELANKAYIEISKLDIPETLRDQLSLFRDQLISEYSLSNPGLCLEIQEGGAIYTAFSNPELHECQTIAISMNPEKLRDYLQQHPTIQSRLEQEAVIKQNELASGTLAIIAMNSQNHILALALDIQRILQYRKSQFLIRLYQFALRRLEQLLESPHIDRRDVEIISRINFLEPYFRDRVLTENEKVILSKFEVRQELVKKKIEAQNFTEKSEKKTLQRKVVHQNEGFIHSRTLLYLMMIFAIAMSLFSFFKFKHKFSAKKERPSDSTRQDNSVSEKKSNSKNGSLKKRSTLRARLEQEDSDNNASSYPRIHQTDTATSKEQEEAVKKIKYATHIAKLKFFLEELSEINLLKSHVEKKLATLRSLSTSLSQKELQLRQHQPKNKLEYDNLKNAEKRLDQQTKSTNYALSYYEKVLSSIEAFNSILNKTIEKNHSIDDITLLCTAVESLSELYEIAKKAIDEMRSEAATELAAKREQHQSIVRMLDNYRIRAMKLVPPLVSQISQQLNRLKSVAAKSELDAEFIDLENASKNLLDELSHFIALVNINYNRLDPIEFEEHAKQVEKAENILNPSHPLHQAVESSYQKTIEILNNSKPKTRSRSDSMEKTDDYESKSFAC